MQKKKVPTSCPYDYHRSVFGCSELSVRLGRRICGQMGDLARDWQTPGVRVPGAHGKEQDMKETGCGFVWADQRTAEQKASEYRNGHIDLVERIERLAEQTDSLGLYRLAATERARISDVNF